MSKERIKDNWTKYYSFILTGIALLLYIVYLCMVANKKYTWPWIADSENFGEMCKSIAQFSSVVLGVYGFFIPVVIGKKDRFSEFFWNNINREAFAKDIQKIIISGILTILISSVLLISDILSLVVLKVMIGMMIVCLTYYSCATYRFLNIFIRIIIGRRSESIDNDLSFKETLTENETQSLNESLNKF